MDAAEETSIKLKYRYAFSTNDLRKTTRKTFNDSFNIHENDDILTEIKTCVTNKQCKLTIIGQTDGKIVYWRPRRRWNENNDNNNKHKFDNNNNNKLVCYSFEGHINACIHSLCYGMCDIMDPKHNKYGLIISGAADSKIKIWDPWHREEKGKEFAILELDEHHNGTILCLDYANKQLISGSTDCTVRIWMVYIPQNKDNYHLRRDLYFKNAKLKQSANAKDEKWKNLSHHKRLNVAKSEPISHAFTHYFANSSYFKNSHNKKHEHLLKGDADDDSTNIKYKNKSKNNNNNMDEIIYPEIHCQQIIKFDAWCRCVCPSNNKYLMIADDNGILYGYYNTSWSSSKTSMISNVSTKSIMSSKSIQSTGSSSKGSDLDGNIIENNKTLGSRSKVKTVYIFDKKTSPIYNIEYYSKLHRLSIIFMLYVANANYIITLSSDYTLQVHDSITCAAIFGVKNPENCKYTSADYNYNHHELYVVDEHGMLQIWDIRREQCLHAQQLRKSPLLKIKCSSSTQIIVTAPDCVEVWNIERIKRPKNAHGHQGDVISVVIIGPSPDKGDINKPLSSMENIENITLNNTEHINNSSDNSVTNLTPDELENNLRNLDTVMYSAGIDNSIRAWDIQSMICRGIFDNENQSSISEISTLIHIHGTRALITGHHNGTLYWWNTDNASNIKLPHAHNDAVTKIHHYQHNNTEILFSIGQDGILAVYDIETKKNEKIFHWQKSIVLSEEHGMLSIISNEEYCYIGSGNGDVYKYDIEMCKISEKFSVCNNINIIDLQIDANFLFIGCEYGDIVIWELSVGFEINRININRDCNIGLQQKCVGIYFHDDSNLIIIVYESNIIVYDYVLGTINEKIDYDEYIASFTFYNGSIFCGCKNSMISRIRLKSFPNESVIGIVKQVTDDLNKSSNQRRFSMVATRIRSPSIQDIIAKRRALEDVKPVINWNKGDREFSVSFNKSFGK